MWSDTARRLSLSGGAGAVTRDVTGLAALVAVLLLRGLGAVTRDAVERPTNSVSFFKFARGQ